MEEKELGPRELLIYLSYKYKGNYMEILNAIKEKPQLDLKEVKSVVEKFISLISNKYKIVTIIDSDYPNCYKKVVFPPIVYYEDKNGVTNFVIPEMFEA